MSPKHLPLGPVMLDIAGTVLGDEDLRRLAHPLAGGVILFARNYAAPDQLARLTAGIHAQRNPPLLIAVDHEGGRVQRFRDGFTTIPPMRALGQAWDANPARARQLARETGYVLAAELRAHGIDFSFGPVLDIDYGSSSVLGDRALHAQPQAVAELARALMQGMKQGGVGAVGKHFPGHGYVRADSHHEVPVDERSYDDIETNDLVPFRRLIAAGLPGIMPAHVIYTQVDRQPAGFSPVWLKQVLRERLAFGGAIFSDDLSMEGASVAGGVIARVEAALAAGCDMALVCNAPAAVDEVCAGLSHAVPPASLARLARMHGRARAATMAGLREDARYVKAAEAVARIGAQEGELPLA